MRRAARGKSKSGRERGRERERELNSSCREGKNKRGEEWAVWGRERRLWMCVYMCVDVWEGEKASWEKFHILAAGGKLKKKNEGKSALELICMAESRWSDVCQKAAVTFSCSAHLKWREGEQLEGGRAEGSGSTEEERGTRQHDQVCVCDCDTTACWMWIAVSERKQIFGVGRF